MAMKSGNGGLRVVSPVPREVWESLLRSDKGAAVTQSLSWRDAVFASGRYRDVSVLYEFGSGRQVVLPLAQRRGQPPHAAMVASWPHEWSVGGPICLDGRVSPAEAAAVLADVARRGALEAQVALPYNADRAWLEAAGRFKVARYGCYVLDLDGGFEHVWQHKFRGTARTAVRKAERSGLDVEVDRSGQLIEVVHELYERSARARAARLREPAWLTRARMSPGRALDLAAADEAGRGAFREGVRHLGGAVEGRARGRPDRVAVRDVHAFLAGGRGRGTRPPGAGHRALAPPQYRGGLPGWVPVLQHGRGPGGILAGPVQGEARGEHAFHP